MTKRTAASLDDGQSPSHGDHESKRRHVQNPAEATDLGEGSATLSQAVPGIPLPSPSIVTPWTSSEISAELPPLPKIADAELERTAFTHPGIDEGRNYERLEWLGDAYLELIASSLIFQTFGRTSSGRCSQLREILIRNTTLADYFRQYDLPSRARLPPEFGKDRELGRGRSKDKDLLKTQGDMFEAYVAAAILSDSQNGLASTAAWLKALWGRTIREQILQNERAFPASQSSGVRASCLTPSEGEVNAKDRLRATIGAKGILIRYQDVPGNSRDKNLGLPLYTVGVYLDGWGEKNKLLGTGTALQKKEAGQRAAAVALQNKKLMKVYEAKKRAFQEAAKAAEEAGA